jgi:hypothetical protein
MVVCKKIARSRVYVDQIIYAGLRSPKLQGSHPNAIVQSFGFLEIPKDVLSADLVTPLTDCRIGYMCSNAEHDQWVRWYLGPASADVVASRKNIEYNVSNV